MGVIERDPLAQSNESLLVEILEGVAEVRGEDVTSLEPISNFLDPESLEEFVTSTSVDTAVEIDVYDCNVSIDGNGNVTVTQLDTID